MDDYDEDPLYEFSQDDIITVLSSFAEANEFLSSIDIEDLCNAYIKLYPSPDGVLLINRFRINSLIEYFVNDGLMRLVNEGRVEMSVGEDGEFYFKAI